MTEELYFTQEYNYAIYVINYIIHILII